MLVFLSSSFCGSRVLRVTSTSQHYGGGEYVCPYPVDSVQRGEHSEHLIHCVSARSGPCSTTLESCETSSPRIWSGDSSPWISISGCSQKRTIRGWCAMTRNCTKAHWWSMRRNLWLLSFTLYPNVTFRRWRKTTLSCSLVCSDTFTTTVRICRKNQKRRKGRKRKTAIIRQKKLEPNVKKKENVGGDRKPSNKKRCLFYKGPGNGKEATHNTL